MAFGFPFESAFLLRKKKAIKSQLLAHDGLIEKRIAVLGGSTTAEVVDQLELFLLAKGIRPVFYQSEYNRYYEDALYPPDTLRAFAPDLIYLHTSAMNIDAYPAMADSQAEVDDRIMEVLQRFQAIWSSLGSHFGCPIVQNNFEEPWQRPLGNLDGSDYRGRSRFVARLNELFAHEASQRPALHIHDIHYLSSRIGMDQWFSPRLWYLYKYAVNLEAIPCLAHQLAAVIAAIWGKTRKALVLDLDNTLWGGVIGDDGLDGIRLGYETPDASAHADLQRYAAALKERGIILAVCSKNDDDNAREGFSHPDSQLSVDDFAAFFANWEPKSSNIEGIAKAINIGLDALVFLDDNPAEREIIRAQLPAVAVPEVGSDITDFIRILDAAACFETVALSGDDLVRSQQYRENSQREQQQAQFASYDEFLCSLGMKAEIAAFSPIYLDRITQLTNKTNQFNLTTRRYSLPEVQAMMGSETHLTLYGRLVDKFGDNGLVSVVAGEIRGDTLHIDLWLMSCRVLKRGLEDAMMEQLCQLARERGVKTLAGMYIPTAKNGMVEHFYEQFGFVQATHDSHGTCWHFDLTQGMPAISHHIGDMNEQE